MTLRVPHLALLAFLLACGPADDAGPPASGSTEAASGAAPGAGAGVQAPRAQPSDGPSDAVPDQRVRAVFLGTSLTAGLGLLRDSERFTDVLQAMADSAGVPLEVVNAGVSGETSAGGLRRLDWVLAEPLDLLVVELGANDGLRGIPVEAMRENLALVVRRTRERHPAARVLLVAMEAPPNLGQRYTSEFREAFSRVAREEGAGLLPFLLEDVAGVASLNQDDRIHPNPEGHRRIAGTLWPPLEREVHELLEARGR
jgi:acyl-CoA thioesterase-1